MNHRENLQFFLFDWLGIDSLRERSRFSEHDRATYDAVLENCERIAAHEFAPHNRRIDLEEPHFDGERVHLPAVVDKALRAYIDSGMMQAAQAADTGGMQLPYSVEMAATSFFSMASLGLFAYPMLTVANANLLLAHGSEEQQRIFARRELAGDWFGTMCLSEPQAGSSLSDVATRAEPDGAAFAEDPLGPRYRLRGNKMWISGGDHELTANIVHLVLAKIPDAEGRLQPGVTGLSLFIVPKQIVGPDGELTEERNDVALAGLNHKLGCRGTTNVLLNFGEGRHRPGGAPGAIGYLVGAPGSGLKCMFHMMNEARIGVGLGGTMIGMAGYQAALEYAGQRLQGRPVKAGSKDAAQAQVRIIEHPDVKRMLLAQKAYCEGALALCLYCARLVDEQHTGTAEAAAEAKLLLEVLTPIAKSWPSEWCLEANSLAIQVHGGYGYTRDFPVEQYWRDNRLNMIHEGTHGIQGIDLLGRKVVMDGGNGLSLLAQRIEMTAQRARSSADYVDEGAALCEALQELLAATQSAWATREPATALANATPYLQAFGHVVLAWIWLELGLAAALVKDATLARGKQSACRYFYRYELPKIGAWLRVVAARDMTCAEVSEECL